MTAAQSRSASRGERRRARPAAAPWLAPAARLAATALVAAATGCGGGYDPPADLPPAADQVARIRRHVEQVSSFRAETTMDYWLGDDRIKGTVLLLGKPGARLRFNAENPTGGNVAVDLACDGVGYELIDYNNNCQLAGPCTAATIAQLLKVSMEPDDFFAMAVGASPVVSGADGRVEWDRDEGRAIVTLATADARWRQRIELDGRSGHFDVLSSTLYDARGDVEWKLEHRGFEDVRAADGSVVRAPRKSKFEQPKRKADLLVVWKDRAFNVDLPPDKFDLDIPPGLPECAADAP